jgi:lambda family phage minor tail protein L
MALQDLYAQPGYWAVGYAQGDDWKYPIEDLQSIAPSSVIEVFQLELNIAQHGVTDVYRFHAGSNLNANGELVWAGNSYLRFPVEAEGFEYSGNGQLPRPKIRIANILSTITAVLLTLPEGLEGAKVTRIRTLARYLDAVNFPGSVNPYGVPDPTAEFPREIYYIDRKTAENRDVVEFELAAAFDLAGVRAPKRQCIANICQWKYRSAECGYATAVYFTDSDQLIRTGSGAPSAGTGVDGDYYYDTTNNLYYGPKAAGAWGAGVSKSGISAVDLCGKRLTSCKLRFGSLIKTGTVTAGSATLTVSSTGGIIAGFPISGPGVPIGATVSAVPGSTTITMSAAATATTSQSKTGTASATSASMTVTDATGLAVGMSVTGLYMPSGTAIASISGTTLTLNQRPYSIKRNAETVDASLALELDSVTGLSAGMRVRGANGINTTIAAVNTTNNRITLTSTTGLTYSFWKDPDVVTLYFMPATPGSSTYTISMPSTTYLFRAGDAQLPFGSFPGVGSYYQ